jgi:hypothetical protein
VLVNTSHNSFDLYRVFKKLCERRVNFELNFPNTFSNEKMTYIPIVDLDELSKLGIHNFSIRDHLGFRKLDWTYPNLKIQNLNCSNFLKSKYDLYINCRS